MDVHILIICGTVEEYKSYLVNNLLIRKSDNSIAVPFVVVNTLGNTYYHECINTDTILSNKYDKLVFISRPKWLIKMEQETKSNMIDYIYDNCVNPIVKQIKHFL